MIYEFEVPLKPFSVNQYHYRDKRHKTAEARAYEAAFLAELEDHKMLLDMAADIKNGSTVSVELCFEWPPHIYYNKAGQISSKTMDLSNVEKPILDLIFGQYMDVNDKVVTRLLSTKRPGPRHSIKIKIELT